MPAPHPTVVVLAASRGGVLAPVASPPAALDAHEVAGTLASAIASRLPVVVVTTPARVAAVRAQVAARDIVEVPDPTLAQGGAIGPAVAAGVAARPDAAGWLVLPGDMPGVRPETLRAVASALGEHLVAYAQHRGRRGHPVAFGAELYSELVTLAGDDAARRLVARFPSHGVDVDDEATLREGEDATPLAAALRRVHGGSSTDLLERTG